MDNTKKNQFLKIMHRILSDLKNKLISIEKRNAEKENVSPKVLSKLQDINSSYNVKENAFIYPDKDTRTIILPGETLLHMKVIGNYIWEFEVKSYEGETFYSDNLSESNDYNSDTISDIIYSIFIKNIKLKNQPKEILPEELLTKKAKIASTLTEETMEICQKDILQEQIDYLTEVIHFSPSNMLKNGSK